MRPCSAIRPLRHNAPLCPSRRTTSLAHAKSASWTETVCVCRNGKNDSCSNLACVPDLALCKKQVELHSRNHSACGRGHQSTHDVLDQAQFHQTFSIARWNRTTHEASCNQTQRCQFRRTKLVPAGKAIHHEIPAFIFRAGTARGSPPGAVNDPPRLSKESVNPFIQRDCSSGVV